jgi:hypothetical protein
MTAITTALSLLFAYLALAPTQPVEARIDYTPAARSSR